MTQWFKKIGQGKTTAGIRIGLFGLWLGSGCMMAQSQSCTFSGLVNYYGDASGGPTFVDFTLTPSNCPWSATSTVPWIQITGTASGTGSGRITYNVTPNNTSQVLSGAIRIQSGNASVVHSYEINPPCSAQVTPGSIPPFSTSGGSGSFSVTPSTAACRWQVQSTANWISGTFASTFGPAAVPFTVAANTGPSRSTTLNLFGFSTVARVTVIQVGTSSITSLVPNIASVGAPALQMTVNGSGFLSASTVRWNTTALGTTFRSATQLIAAIPASLLTNAGTANVTVETAGAVTSPSAFTITTGPTISSLTPASSAAGVAGFILTVNGSGFGTTSRVRWNNTLLVTSFISPSELRATVSSGMVTSSGTASIAVDVAGGATNSLPFTITSNPALSASPADLTFQYRPGEAAPPPQSFSVFSTRMAAPFTAVVQTSAGGTWLSASPTSGQTGQDIQVSVTPGNLATGSYQGTVTINSSSTTPSSRVVRVFFGVAPSQPQLEVSPREITATAVQGGPMQSVQLAVTNSGGGRLTYSAQKISGANWLGVRQSTTPGTVPVVETSVTMDPAGLPPGVYTGHITVVSGTQTKTVDVTMAVSRISQSILLSQTGMEFIVPSDSPTLPGQTLGIGNSGQGRMDWTLETDTIPAGQNWLRVTPGSGSHTPGAAASLAQIGADPKGLAPGRYYGTVRVTAPGAANTPQSVPVTLTVLAADDNPGVQPSVSGILQVGQAGGANPASEAITLTNQSARSVGFTTTRRTEDGTAWFTASPASGTIPAWGTMRVTVQSALATLSAGVRRGSLRFGFDDGTVRTVTILASTTTPSFGAPATTGAAMDGEREAIPNCRASRLLVQFVSLENGFTVTAQTSNSVRVQVKDDCDNLVGAGSVKAFFTGGRSVTLAPDQPGFWAGTWVPPAPNEAEQVAAQALQVTTSARLGGDSAILNGRVVAATATAQAAAQDVRNNATNQSSGQVALGSWVSIFGERLSQSTKIADTVPYPFTLEETEVRMGNLKLPLFFVSQGQINALIPAGLVPNTQHQLLVRRGDTLSPALAVTVAEIQPGIYAMNSQGFGQGAVLIANTALLVAAPDSVPGWFSRAAKKGEFVQIYAAGLGGVANPPPDGNPGNGELVLEQPQVIIGGQPAQVTFAGLLPGAIGLYQVNAVIPEGAASGPAVPMQMRQRDTLSNTVTIAVE